MMRADMSANPQSEIRNPQLADFPVRLKKWRGDRTQAEAARVLQVPLRTYQGWESGRPAGALSIAAITARMAAIPSTQPAQSTK